MKEKIAPFIILGMLALPIYACYLAGGVMYAIMYAVLILYVIEWDLP